MFHIHCRNNDARAKQDHHFRNQGNLRLAKATEFARMPLEKFTARAPNAALLLLSTVIDAVIASLCVCV